MTGDGYNRLRTCSYDSKFWLTHSGGDLDGEYLCPEHLTAMFRGFDPQPKDTVRFLRPTQVWGDWLVTAREGDTLTIHPLGNPGAPSQSVQVYSMYPGDGWLNAAIQRGLEIMKRERKKNG